MGEIEYEYTAYVRGTVYANSLEEAQREVGITIGQFCSVDIEDIEPCDPLEDDDATG